MSDEQEHAIGEAVNRFLDHVDSLATTLPLTMLVIDAVHKQLQEDFEKFRGDHCTITPAEDGGEDILVHSGQLGRYNKLVRRLDHSALAHITVPRSFVVSLVSQYDAFLGRLLRGCYALKPELLTSSEKPLTFSQLSEFRSLDDAKEYVLEKEVESVLRLSHPEQFDWLESKFKLELRKGLNEWPDFVEITERRNLLVHTDGVVSSQYLSACTRHKVGLAEGLKVGDELNVNRQYFENSYRCMFEIGTKLAHVLWRKLDEGTREAADENLNRICYTLLSERKFELAKRLLDFATQVVKKYSSEQYRRFFIINRAQAYKWSNDNGRALQILDAEDWSATSDAFRLSEAVLRENYEQALAMMRRIGASGDVDKGHYREWPVFREFRKTDEFAETFKEIFGEPFNKVHTADKQDLKPINESVAGRPVDDENH